MIRLSWQHLVVVGSCSLAACASVPRVNTENESAAIRQIDQRMVQSLAARDQAALANYYAPNAALMMANAPKATGRAAIGSAWGSMLGLPNFAMSFTPTSITVARSGDLATDVGTYQLSFDGPQGRVNDVGKYTVGWQKIDGQWLIASDMANSDLPMPAPAAPVAMMDGMDAQMQGSAALQWSDLVVPGVPSGVKMTVLHGDPSKNGDYTMRLKFPDGYVIPAHWHPEGEHVTILQGNLMLAMGERYAASGLKSYMPGDFLYAPGKMSHFGLVHGETIVQVHGVGPFQLILTKPAT